MKRVISIMLTVIMLVGIVVVPGITASAAVVTGTLITFGTYPQTSVIDEAQLKTLNSKKLSWKYYDYYAAGKREDYMQYADVSDVFRNGDKYRAVKFSHYRPYYTISNSYDTSYQSRNGYEPNKVYWFEFEPIVWRILDPDTGLMLTENIIDSQPFHNEYYTNINGRYYGDSEYQHYVSNWKYSSLKKWLNNDFYNTAFSSENSYIKTSSLITPSRVFSEYDADPTTDDKVYLLSTDDMINESYGYNSNNNGGADFNRIAYGTDYARCQGLWVDSSYGNSYSGASWWCLRSPSDSYGIGYVEHDRNGFRYSGTYYTYCGIRAALNADLQSAISDSLIKITNSNNLVVNGPSGMNIDHAWNGGEIITPATCNVAGTKTYTCNVCGATKTESINATGHAYGEWTKLDEEHHQRICKNDTSHTETAAHEWNAGVISKVPTVDSEGEKTYTCAVCGAVKTEPIPKKKPEFILGDVNNDGKVLADDARLALRNSATLKAFTAEQTKAADVNEDGIVLADDARQILRYSAKLQNEFIKKQF